MISCVSGLILRSCSAKRYQDGNVFQSGFGAFSWRKAPLIGRCTAANRALSFGLAFCAKAECAFRHPDEAVTVGCQLRRLRMRLSSAEHFADGLALVGRQRSDEDQALYALVLRARDDGASIGVRGQYDRPLDPCQTTIQGSNVVPNAR